MIDSDFKENFAPTLAALVTAREWFERVLPKFLETSGAHSLANETANMMVLCLSEVMANTVDYASPPATKISMSLALDGNKICIEIEDDGAPFHNFYEAVDASRHMHDEPTLDERGRGLYLVGNMCADLRYTAKNETDFPFNKTVLIYDTTN